MLLCIERTVMQTTTPSQTCTTRDFIGVLPLKPYLFTIISLLCHHYQCLLISSFISELAKMISFSIVPIAVAATVWNAVRLEKAHHAHDRPEFVKYEYLAVRNKVSCFGHFVSTQLRSVNIIPNRFSEQYLIQSLITNVIHFPKCHHQTLSYSNRINSLEV